MDKVLFCGCSYVYGSGLDKEVHDPFLWVNMLHQSEILRRFQLVNSSEGGKSNTRIFQDAVFNISKGNVKYAFICWTSNPRYEVSLGLELYATKACFSPNVALRDYNLNHMSYSKKYLQTVRDRFVSLANLHYEILNIVYYVNSLINLAKKFNTKIFFVNTLCEWDEYYFNKIENVLPDNYTTFTQQLLQVTTRDDEEILKLYNKIHHEYNQAGGIQESYWLNLYNSLRNQKIDVNQDNIHPGIKSNHLYYKTFLEILKEKLDTV